MKLARFIALAALSLAAFAQEGPKNLDIIHAKYNGKPFYSYGTERPAPTGVWVAVYLLDHETRAVEITLTYQTTTTLGKTLSRTSTQVVNRIFPFPLWVSAYFPVGDVEMKSITATALVQTESRTISSES